MNLKAVEQTIIIKSLLVIFCSFTSSLFCQNKECIRLSITNKDTINIFVPVDIDMENAFRGDEVLVYSNGDTLYILIDSVTTVMRGDVSIVYLRHLPLSRILLPKKTRNIKVCSSQVAFNKPFIKLKYGKRCYFFCKKRKNKYKCYKYIMSNNT